MFQIFYFVVSLAISTGTYLICQALKDFLTFINPCTRCAVIEQVTEQKMSKRFEEVFQDILDLKQQAVESQRKIDESQREIQQLKEKAQISQRDSDDSKRKVQTLKEKTMISQREIQKLKGKAVVSQRETEKMKHKASVDRNNFSEKNSQAGKQAVASRQKITNLVAQVAHITSVYVVSYQAILRRSLLHNARKSLCKDMGIEPVRDSITGYLKWNQALWEIYNSTTLSWEGRKFTRANVLFIINNSDTGTSDAHPNIEHSIVPLAFSVTAADLGTVSRVNGFVDLFRRCLPGQDPLEVVGLESIE